MISTYINFIALQWKLGYKYHLPQHNFNPDGKLTKPYLESIFKNVSFPTAYWKKTKDAARNPWDAGSKGNCLYGVEIIDVELSLF